MSLEQALADCTAAIRELIVVMQSGGAGNAAVAGTPAPPDARKLTYYHLPDRKEVLKVGPKAEKPIGGVEVTAKEFAELEKKYAEAKNAAAAASNPSGQAAQAQTSAAAQGGTQTGSTFQDVTSAITILSKKKMADDKIDGREAVVKLLAKWGVDRFPKVQGTKSNEELIKDINAMLNPSVPSEDDMSALGL